MDQELAAPAAPLRPTVRAAPKWIASAVDYGPLLAFFVAYEFGGLMTATIVVMAATLLALALGFAFTRRIAFMPLLTAVIVGVLGGLTLWLNDPDFIKMKPTIVYTLFALMVAIELFSGRPLLIKAMMAAAPAMHPAGRRVLLLRFLVFFAVMAAANEVARRILSTDHWVLWKVPGAIGITFLFALAQMPLILRHKLPDEEQAPPNSDDSGIEAPPP